MILPFSAESDSSVTVSGLQFVHADTFLVCSESGDLCLYDTRTPSALQSAYFGNQGVSTWHMGLKKGPSQSDITSCRVAQLSSSGQVAVSDLRDLRGPLCQAQLNVQHKTPCSDFITVTWAPTLNDHLAVSGKHYITYLLLFTLLFWTLCNRLSQMILPPV